MPIIKRWGHNERPRTDDLTVSISVGTPPRQRELWKKRQDPSEEEPQEPSEESSSSTRASIFAEPEAFFDVDGELVTLDTVNCRAFKEVSGTKEEIDFAEFLHIWMNFPRISAEKAAKLRAASSE